MRINYGYSPFWFWNGDMEDHEIARQIREMKDKGIGGFFIHPRQGLTVPYLSRQWFDKVALAVEEAKKYGLDVWLYDEYPYPSGIAGGEVILQHPEFEAKILQPFRMEVSSPGPIEADLPWGKVLIAAAYPVVNGQVEWDRAFDLMPFIGTARHEKIFQMSGLTAYNRKRFFEGDSIKKLSWQAPAGQWRIYIFSEVVMENMKFFGKFVDPMNPGAVTYFIETTHEQYKKHLGCEFGKTIKGIFSDETDVNPAGGEIRWSPLLPEVFEKRNGYSLIDKLPALMESMGEGTAKIRYDYWNTLTDAFIHSYDAQIQDWCRQNGLLYTAEKPILRSSQIQYMDLPGIDAGHQKVGAVPAFPPSKYRANGKLLSSGAHFYKKERALCECYHSVGWGMTLQDMKWMVDWLAVQGVNLLVPHAFFYTSDGLAKHDAPPSQFFQQPSWKHTGALSRYVADLCSVLSGGNARVDILLVDSVTSQWTSMGEKKGIKNKVAEDFARLQKVLFQQHIDFYIIDPQLLGESTVKGKQILVGEEAFRVVILPPMLNIEADALKKVGEFIAAGGTVIAACCMPAEKIAAVDPAPLFSSWFGVDANASYEAYTGLASHAGLQAYGNSPEGAVFVSDIEKIPGIIEKYWVRDLSVSDSGGQIKEIMAVHYSKAEGEYYFFTNTSGSVYEAEIKFKLDEEKLYKNMNFCIFRLDTGSGNSRVPVEYGLENGYVCIPAHFAPFQSYMYMMDCQKTGNAAQEQRIQEHSTNGPSVCDKSEFGFAAQDHCGCGIAESDRKKVELDAGGRWEFSISGPNALRMDDWSLMVTPIEEGKTPWSEQGKQSGTGKREAEKGEGQKGVQEVRYVKSRPIIDQIAESGLPIPINLTSYFGCPRNVLLPRLACSYSTEFLLEVPADRGLWLVMEPGSISGAWHILVNGHKITESDFVKKAFYLPANMAANITSLLQPGRNRIEVRVETSETFDGLVNPLYLFGEFGVGKTDNPRGWTLSALLQAGGMGDAVGCGIPFYAGEIIYRKRINLEDNENGLELYMKGMQDPVELYINGRCAGVRSWEPYCWQIEKEWLQPGLNEIELHVSNTVLGLFEGQVFDSIAHRYVDISL